MKRHIRIIVIQNDRAGQFGLFPDDPRFDQREHAHILAAAQSANTRRRNTCNKHLWLPRPFASKFDPGEQTPYQTRHKHESTQTSWPYHSAILAIIIAGNPKHDTQKSAQRKRERMRERTKMQQRNLYRKSEKEREKEPNGRGKRVTFGSGQIFCGITEGKHATWYFQQQQRKQQ